MIGAIIGDIVGSRFEWDNIKTKDFTFFHDDCFYTDDSVMTVAVAWAIMQSGGNMKTLGSHATRCMRSLGQRHPFCGYGGHFMDWLFASAPKPYFSYGNGAAMRVSPCGFAADSIQAAIDMSRAVTEVTHNHPEGIRGAEATAVAVYMARTGSSIDEIRKHICNRYYAIDFTLDEIRNSYRFDESCMDTVPQALEAFFESTGFEDAIRNAISIGGDSDTVAAITGSIAEAYYGIPDGFAMTAFSYLNDDLIRITDAFEKRCPRIKK